MEQKRTLWIIAAVGLFLVVVLGGALMVTAPFTHKSQTIASVNRTEKNTTSNGWIPLATTDTPAQIPSETNQTENDYIDMSGVAQTPSSVSEMTIYADNATIYSENTKLNDESLAASQNTNPGQTIINNTTTIDLNSLANQIASAQTESKKQNEQSTVKEPAKTTNKEEVSVKKANASKNTTQVASNVTKKENKTVSKVVKTTTPVVSSKPEKTVYWIQVTALTSRKSADAAREVLDQNQITADVFTYKDKKDQLFYRVRVGPYTTKSEAEYWQTKIAKIDNFKNNAGYITSTPVETN